MKLATFRATGTVTWGIIQDDQAFDLGSLFHAGRPDLRSALGSDLAEFKAAASRASRHALEAIEWLPVIPNPPKIICIGLNYDMHVKETGRSAAQYPTLFARYANTQIGHGAGIVRPRVSTRLDYEGELAVIIGKPGRHIARADAWSHVAGYSCYNDASVRDWQRHTSQFTPGKNFPGTGEIGPQRIQTRVNGAVLQDATLGEMIFDIPHIIEYCSAFTRLEPGDVIATGTPGGVGDRREPPLWLKPGDTVEVEIGGIGTLRNAVVDEAPA
jgi:2-keto-4-pentenoate hydratase/2-oxohepta-3-ene-1,7-dioic acid hydratase in catechol pathway